MLNRAKDLTGIKKLLNLYPVTSILGARQIGKTTLAKQFQASHYLDLENPRDLARLDHPQLALEDLKGLIVIDEIQRKPDLFPLLRYLVDENPQQKYLILGSASNVLIKQSSESLAGRIAYYHLGGLSLSDAGKEHWKSLWSNGGYPRSFLAPDEDASALWRENYISTFLERDIPQLGISIPAQTMRRFWTMLSHFHGQIINYAEFAKSFGISDMTVRKYTDILEGTFMVRLLQPWFRNIGKRLVKRPKLYLRDSGIFHTLLSIQAYEQLITHPKLGSSWEGFALELTCKSIGKRDQEFYFWKTHSGAELDLFWQNQGKNWGIEFKYQDAPKLTKSMQSCMSDLELAHLWIVYPGKQKYKLATNITTLPLTEISENWDYS